MYVDVYVVMFQDGKSLLHHAIAMKKFTAAKALIGLKVNLGLVDKVCNVFVDVMC